MKHLHLVVAVLGVGVIAGSQLAAQDASPQAAVISTSGTGTVQLEADQATLSVGVEVQAPTATAAREDMDRRIAGVLDTLVSIGFPRDSLFTAGYVVRPIYDYERNRRITGYAAATSIEITIRDLALVAPVIVAALEAGGTTLGMLRFDSSEREAARQEALRLAVAEARRDAETIARAAGGALGDLVELSTDQARPMYEPGPAPFVAMEARAAQPQVNPRDITVSATVHARWRFVAQRLP